MIITIILNESLIESVALALSIIFNVIFGGLYLFARWDVHQLETECKFWKDWKNNEQERFMKIQRDKIREKQAKKQEETEG